MKKFSLLNYLEIISMCIIGTILHEFLPNVYMIFSIVITALTVLYIFAVFVYVKLAHIRNPLYSPILCVYLACIVVSAWIPIITDVFPIT